MGSMEDISSVEPVLSSYSEKFLSKDEIYLLDIR